MFPKYETQGVGTRATPWFLAFQSEMARPHPSEEFPEQREGYRFELFTTSDALWVRVYWPDTGEAAFRVAYCPGHDIDVGRVQIANGQINHQFNCGLGMYRVLIELPNQERAILHWTAWLTPHEDLIIPYWPRDMYILGPRSNLLDSEGILHQIQLGPQGGLLFLTAKRPYSGSLLYFQNLTTLNQFFEMTKTSPSSRVGGEWPELGFSPPNVSENPLKKDEEVAISDASVCFSTIAPENDRQEARLFLDMLTEIYLSIARPETQYHDWLSQAENCLKSLSSPKCFVKIKGKKYLRAYVGDKKSPPESMVQFTAWKALAEYDAWRHKKAPLTRALKNNLESFYQNKLQTIIRYLPGEDFGGEIEEQQHPNVMDSWYLYHPLLNLGRMAKHGDQEARDLFFKSIDFGIKVARRFKYHWPIFYDIMTLEVIKAEAAPGQGGETDVACIYMKVMMDAWDLSKDRRYLQEAKKAAEAILDKGFNLLYQANVTAFGADALWSLYKATGNTLYRDMSFVCVANIFNNTWLWECNYGYAKDYRTFLGIFPLQEDAYIASFEEKEVLTSLNEYSIRAFDELPPSMRLLMAEVARYEVDRCWYYFPGHLPKEAVAEESKTGKVDRKLAIPLEDLYDGWKQSGMVGQEVYGGSGITILITHLYIQVDGIPFMIFCDYPTRKPEAADIDLEKKKVTFDIRGDERLPCVVRMIPLKGKLPEISINTGRDGEFARKGKPTQEGHLEYSLPGNTNVIVHWK